MKKTILLIMIGILGVILLTLGGTAMMLTLASEPESACRFQYTTELTVKDGQIYSYEESASKTDVYVNSIPFSLSKSTSYDLHLTWETPNTETVPGFLTLMILKDAEGKVLNYVSGDAADVTIEPMTMDAGEYLVEYRYYIDEAAFRTDLIELGAKVSPEPQGSYLEYAAFGNEGFWEMHITFDLQPAGYATGSQMLYYPGMIIGIATALILILVFRFLFTKDHSFKNNYDERQILCRGKAYQYGFFSVILYLFLWLCFCRFELPAETDALLLFGILLGVFVFAVYSIWNDAYFSLNDKKLPLLVLFITLAILDTLIGVSNLLRNQSSGIINGKLTLDEMSLACGIFLLMLVLIVLVKSCLDKAEENQ